MFSIIKKINDLNIQQLQHVYAQSISRSGGWMDRNTSIWNRGCSREASWGESLYDFFMIKGAMIALWTEAEHYVSALRLEPHLDGYLLTCLETAPDAREKGFATALVRHVCCNVQGKIYSHVMKNNLASMAVHKKCGFIIIADHARLLDGTVSQRYCTFCTQK